MLIPHKYEDISQNMLSIGLDVLRILKKKRNVYNLYKELLEMMHDGIFHGVDKRQVLNATRYVIDKSEEEFPVYNDEYIVS